MSRADDMHTIRAALGLDAGGPRPPRGARPESTGVVAGRPATPRPDGRKASGTELVKSGGYRKVPVRRRRMTTILWAAVAAVTLGGGVAAGFYARGVVLERGVATTRAAAAAAAHTDSWRGWQVARDDLVRIADARGGATARAAVARARAVLAADFGYDPAGARAAATGDEPDAAVARAYLALLDGDATAAAAAADQARRAVGGAVGDYLVGRAALLGERWDDARAAFDQAVSADPRPAYYLGRAQAAAGAGRYKDALADCDRALGVGDAAGGVPGHVRALIERARIVAASSAAPEALAAAAAGLDQVAAEAGLATAEQALGVSPLEQSLAALARAELEHARGDDAAARRDLERAGTAAGDDLIIADGVIELHLALGDEARAVELAQRAATTWPRSQGPRIALAAAALAAGDAGKALDALTKAGDVSDRPLALALRGRAHLAAGDLEAAAKDLDAALDRMPGDEATLQARAEVDLARGDAKTAVARLAKRAGATAASPSLLVTYAAALRASGQRAQAKKLLDRLTEAGAVGGDRGRPGLARARPPGRVRGRPPDRARRLRQGGHRPAARDRRGDPGPPRGRGPRARRQRPGDRTGRPRPAGRRRPRRRQRPGRGRPRPRPHRRSGRRQGPARPRRQDLVGAALADRARARPPRPAHPDRPRRGPGPRAGRVELAPDDAETRLLLIDADLMTRNEKGARHVLDDVLKRFHGKPAAKLAAGRLAYYFSHDAEARRAFGQARDQLVKSRARPRAVADATYWLGRVRYDDNPDEARRLLVEATTLDPTLSDGYVFLGLIDSDKNDPQLGGDLVPEGDPARSRQRRQLVRSRPGRGAGEGQGRGQAGVRPST